MAILRKDRWTEDEVLAFPVGEQPDFERKSGSILNGPDYIEVLAKAACAFANSGGGYLLIGVADNGDLDGVPKIIKGREKAKDWFEKLIPRLLSYPLQDFSVHEVVPSKKSIIKPGRAVLVIEIDDSPLAPHQTAGSKVYFHRSGGKSEPASHFFLDLLWGRQKFPGPRVARTWLNGVIRPLRINVEGELAYLAAPGWQRDVYNRLADTSSGGLFKLHNPTLANQEQFLDFYPALKELIDRHDNLITSVYDSAEKLEEEILNSPKLRAVRKKTLSRKSLQRLRDLYPEYRDGYPKDKDLIGYVFGYESEQKQLEILAVHIVSYADEIEPSQSRVARFWNLFIKDLMSVLKAPIVRDHYAKLMAEGQALRELATMILSNIREIRKHLSTRYSEPFEEMSRETHPVPFRQQFWDY